MPDKVVRLSEEFLEFPVRVEVTPPAQPAQTVQQVLYEVPNRETKLRLLDFLLHRDAEQMTRVLFFARTKTNADQLAAFLQRHAPLGEVRVIHGNKGQNARLNSMDAFREGAVRYLVATDVAARGIDVPQVSHVVNFDVPLIYDDYVHRIGRTGRARHTGAALTFATPAEAAHVAAIEALIKQPIPRQPLPPAVEVAPTPFAEAQQQARAQDEQRRRQDPNFKGAFHEKKAWVKPGVTIDKRTGRPFEPGPRKSQKGAKRRPSAPGTAKPGAKPPRRGR